MLTTHHPTNSTITLNLRGLITHQRITFKQNTTIRGGVIAI